MNGYSKCILAGNLTKDPEDVDISGDTTLCKGGIAVNRKYKDSDGKLKENVSFFNFEMWGRKADTFLKYMSKGSPVLIEGRLQQDRWETDQGKSSSKDKVVVSNFTFLGGGVKDESETEDGPQDDLPF